MPLKGVLRHALDIAEWGGKQAEEEMRADEPVDIGRRLALFGWTGTEPAGFPLEDGRNLIDTVAKGERLVDDFKVHLFVIFVQR